MATNEKRMESLVEREGQLLSFLHGETVVSAMGRPWPRTESGTASAKAELRRLEKMRGKLVADDSRE